MMLSRAAICWAGFALVAVAEDGAQVVRRCSEGTEKDCETRAAAVLSHCSDLGGDCKETMCCKDEGVKCYEKNAGFAICRVNCTPGIDKNDDPKWRTNWSCHVLDASLPTTTVTTTTPVPLPSPNCTGEFDFGGTDNRLYIGGGGVDAAEDTLNLTHPAFFELLSECPPNNTNWTGSEFHQFRLLGKNVTYTVDLSAAGCACNFALYLIALPAKREDGSPDPGAWGDYYCDAAGVGGHLCPEIDIMEANNRVFQATPHACDPPKRGHYSKCDRNGCMLNTRDSPGSYGPGPDFEIDTRHPFTVNAAFVEKGGKLVNLVTVLQQGEHEVVLDQSNTTCSGKYLEGMTSVLKDGMAMRITYWGEKASGMAWMDSPPCGEGTCTGENAGNTIIRGLAVLDASAPSPTTARPTTAPRATGDAGGSGAADGANTSAAERAAQASNTSTTTTTAKAAGTTETSTAASAHAIRSLDDAPAGIREAGHAARAAGAHHAATRGTSHWVPITAAVGLATAAIMAPMAWLLRSSHWRQYLRLQSHAGNPVVPLNE